MEKKRIWGKKRERESESQREIGTPLVKKILHRTYRDTSQIPDHSLLSRLLDSQMYGFL